MDASELPLRVELPGSHFVCPSGGDGSSSISITWHPETSGKMTITADELLITEALHNRPPRRRDLAREIEAINDLARGMVRPPLRRIGARPVSRRIRLESACWKTGNRGNRSSRGRRWRAGIVKIRRGPWNEDLFRVLEGFCDFADDDEVNACDLAQIPGSYPRDRHRRSTRRASSSPCQTDEPSPYCSMVRPSRMRRLDGAAEEGTPFVPSKPARARRQL